MIIDTQFKIKSIPRLLTFNELVMIAKRANVGKVRVVDMKQKRSYKTDITTIIRKFG